MVRRIALVALLIAGAVVAYFLLRNPGEANAEAKYDGVHLCSSSQQAAATAQGPRPTPSPSATRVPSAAGQPPSGAGDILFAQNDAAWGKQEYDSGTKQNIGCGQTIAQCGCAMTSVATILKLFQVLSTPDGKELNPSSLNSWFNQGAQLTSSGWASQGYIFGNVVWTAVNNFSSAVGGPTGGAAGPAGGAVADSAAATPIRFKGWGPGSEQFIKDELNAGHGVAIEVPGHFIAAIGVQGDQILISDPFYRERTTLASYAGRVKSSRVFEPSQDLRAIMISVPANLRVKVTDSQGRTVGSLAKGSAQEVEKGAKTDIPGSAYHFEEAWRDPTCTERPPPDGAGVNTIFLPSPEKGSYNVEVLNPAGGDTASAVYTYDRNGKMKLETHGGGSSVKFVIDYDQGAAPPPPTPVPATPTPTATATASPTPTSAARPAATGTPTATAVVTSPEPAGDTPTPTATPPGDTPTPTNTVPPGRVTIRSFSVVLHESQVGPGAPGCNTLISWTVDGDPNGSVQLLRNSAVIYSASVGPDSFTDAFAIGTWTYQLRAFNGTGDQAAISQQVTVTPVCLAAYSAVDASPCNEEPCVDNNWVVQGAAGTVRVMRRVVGFDGSFKVIYSEGITPGNRFFRDRDKFPPCSTDIDYQLQVVLANRTLISPTYRIHLTGIFCPPTPTPTLPPIP